MLNIITMASILLIYYIIIIVCLPHHGMRSTKATRKFIHILIISSCLQISLAERDVHSKIYSVFLVFIWKCLRKVRRSIFAEVKDFLNFACNVTWGVKNAYIWRYKILCYSFYTNMEIKDSSLYFLYKYGDKRFFVILSIQIWR